MSYIKLPQEAAGASGGASIYMSFLYRQLPHIVVLVLAISGVAYANISHQPLIRILGIFRLWRWQLSASSRNGQKPTTGALTGS